MLIPSIDIQGGRAVQLRQGRVKILDGGDPMEVARGFSRLGEIAVVDLDAATGVGDNREIIEELVRTYPCRVGGGIRDVDAALRWLNVGATRVVIGTAAEPSMLVGLPRERVIVAVDAWNDEVVVEGWRKETGESVESRIRRLRPYVGGFLATFVQNEGTGEGLDIERAKTIRRLVPELELVVAGGTRSAGEIATLDAIGVDVQVGRGLYDGSLNPAEIIATMMWSDRVDGLYSTVVCDESGRALGLAYSSRRSIERTLETGRVFYESRRRGLWEKGATSGAVQRLVRIDLDCDRDALRYTVEQERVGFCHLNRWTCWDDGGGIERLERRLGMLGESGASRVEGSYTQKLLGDRSMLRSKILEEAGEFVATDADSVHEAADLLYFVVTSLVSREVRWRDVVRELDRRALGTIRRGGDVKPVVAEVEVSS
ncbi:MAG: phosphoribosyl-ATP diphosphatase [Phycisphaera sp.]|nr:phosphoribosyl-ATP diphosphatase [Phycisphaera sp.]